MPANRMRQREATKCLLYVTRVWYYPQLWVSTGGSWNVSPMDKGGYWDVITRVTLDRLCLIPSGRTSRGFCAHSGGENEAGHGCQRGDREPFPRLCALCLGSLAEGHSPQTLACTALLWRCFPQTFQLKLLPTPCMSTQWPSAFPLNDTRASLMTCFVIIFSMDPFKFQRAGETSVQSGTSRVQLRN